MNIETILILLAIWVCIIPLLLADAITYKLARIVTHRAGDNDTVDYFVAGMCCQPLQAFAFMFGLPALKGDTLKLLPYSQRRAHFQKMTKAILDDVAKKSLPKGADFCDFSRGNCTLYGWSEGGDGRGRERFRTEMRFVKGVFSLEIQLFFQIILQR